jgi:hypothetical protein
MITGVIMTTVKFQSQLELIPIAVPLVRASRGRISGTYTHGTELIDMPWMSMKRKKKDTDAEAYAVPLGLSTCDNSAATIIMQTPKPKEPIIIVRRRPIRSSMNAGRREPSINII